jgi:putative ABC transport system permease protein
LRLADILAFALTALKRQRGRTLLTLLGVVLGAFTLFVSLSLGKGVKDTAMREIRRHHQLREIEVWPARQYVVSPIPDSLLEFPGDMSDERRERLREVIRRNWNAEHGKRIIQHALTRDRLAALAALDHVEKVVPHIVMDYHAIFEDKAQDTLVYSLPADNTALLDRLVAGDGFTSDSDHSVLVHEYLLYRWGFHDEAAMRTALGKTIRLEYPSNSARRFLPSARQGDVALREDFAIAGVLRDATPSERSHRGGSGADADLVLPARTGEELYLRLVRGSELGFDRATVRADSEDNVRALLGQIEAQGLEAMSLVDVADRVRLHIVLITFATGFVAAVALLVACLGITNVMLMSVLERTHEIGVMKAVGARDGHIQLIFLLEGALIGLVGGGLGLLCSWIASIPGDSLARSLIEKQTLHRIEGSVFSYPLWMTLGIPFCTGLVTTLAAVYPARRAARVDPVTALRHE